LKVAILVEGRTDRDSIQIIVQRFHDLHQARISTSFYAFGGGARLLDVEGVVRAVSAYKKVDPELSAAVVCKDIDCIDKSEHRRIVDRIRAQLVDSAPIIPIRYHFVRYELESWLAADPGAWERKFPRAKPYVLPDQILEDCSPKERIREHLRSRGIEFRYTQHDEQIAADLEISTAISRCPNLREFLESLAV